MDKLISTLVGAFFAIVGMTLGHALADRRSRRDYIRTSMLNEPFESLRLWLSNIEIGIIAINDEAYERAVDITKGQFEVCRHWAYQCDIRYGAT